MHQIFLVTLTNKSDKGERSLYFFWKLPHCTEGLELAHLLNRQYLTKRHHKHLIYHDSYTNLFWVTLIPCPFTGCKMFCAGPNFFCRTKNLFTYCASHKHFVPDKKMICIHALSFYRSQNVLCRSKFFEPAQKFECI